MPSFGKVIDHTAYSLYLENYHKILGELKKCSLQKPTSRNIIQQKTLEKKLEQYGDFIRKIGVTLPIFRVRYKNEYLYLSAISLDVARVLGPLHFGVSKDEIEIEFVEPGKKYTNKS